MIPVVDIGALVAGREKKGVSEAEWQRVAQQLYEALSSVGFVYLSNHGIAETQINDFINAYAKFFSLDLETKAKYKVPAHLRLRQYNGYIHVDQERLDKTGELFEFRESYFVKDLDDVLPDSEVPETRSSAEPFIASCTSLSNYVLTALAIGLGLERDFFTSTHQGMYLKAPSNRTVARVNHYPPLPSSIPDGATRCGEHSDFGSITLLFQDSMGGLQVRNVDGKWVDAVPIPGTVLVNAGDLLQMWTANRIKATKHRVLIPKEEARQRASRYSVAFFIVPDDEVLVQPIEGSTAHPPILARQHLYNRLSNTHKY